MRQTKPIFKLFVVFSVIVSFAAAAQAANPSWDVNFDADTLGVPPSTAVYQSGVTNTKPTALTNSPGTQVVDNMYDPSQEDPNDPNVGYPLGFGEGAKVCKLEGGATWTRLHFNADPNDAISSGVLSVRFDLFVDHNAEATANEKVTIRAYRADPNWQGPVAGMMFLQQSTKMAIDTRQSADSNDPYNYLVLNQNYATLRPVSYEMRIDYNTNKVSYYKGNMDDTVLSQLTDVDPNVNEWDFDPNMTIDHFAMYSKTGKTGWDNIRIRVLIPGDASLDDQVGAADLALLAANWGAGSGDPNGGTPRWESSDFNSDDAVGAADLALLAANWGVTGYGDGAGAVPEPATMTLLGVGAVGLFIRRKRQK